MFHCFIYLFLVFFSLLQSKNLFANIVTKVKSNFIIVKTSSQIVRSNDFIQIVDKKNPKKLKGIYKVIKQSKRSPASFIAKRVQGSAIKKDKFLLLPKEELPGYFLAPVGSTLLFPSSGREILRAPISANLLPGPLPTQALS